MNPLVYPAEIAEILAIPAPMPLGPGKPDHSVADRLRSLTKLSPVCRAGLWLRFNFLEESHRLSQELETPEGSAWHAIMHRREPDGWNSKYWWRRVGSHPFVNTLRSQAKVAGYDYTTPISFVDFCEQARGTGSESEQLAEAVQQLEWQLLFEYCFRSTHTNDHPAARTPDAGIR